MQAVDKQKFVGRFSLSAEWPLQRCNSSFCPNSCFFSKTCDCHPPNDCFSQKRAIVTPRTGRRNDVKANIAHRIDCCNDVKAHIAPRMSCCKDVTAHIAPRIGCCKAQQVFIRSMRREQQHFCTVCSTFSTQ